MYTYVRQGYTHTTAPSLPAPHTHTHTELLANTPSSVTKIKMEDRDDGGFYHSHHTEAQDLGRESKEECEGVCEVARKYNE